MAPLDPVPMAEAARLVNDNNAKITATLRATGSVDGRFTLPDGRTRRYHVDGVLFYLAPHYLRFDLKVLGSRQFLFGSNAEHYWYYGKEDDAYYCERHDAPGRLAAEMPVTPEQLVDALGLTPIPAPGASTQAVRMVPRVVDEYQQILFLSRGGDGEMTLHKEYWMDRYPPRLVRRIVFRDADGVVTFESRLDDYRALSSAGPWLPHLMIAEWPQSRAGMRFRVGRWRLVEGVGRQAIQFKAPRECTGR